MKRYLWILMLVALCASVWASRFEIYRAGTRDWIYTIEGDYIYRAGTRDCIYRIEKAD